jgi:hypothetical protein
MNFEAYVTSLGLDLTKLTTELKAALQSQWRSTIKPDPVPAVTQPNGAALPVATRLDDAANRQRPLTVDEEVAGYVADATRRAKIKELTRDAIKAHAGNLEKINQINSVCNTACENETTTVHEFQLALMRLERYAGPMVFAPAGGQQLTEEVLEAAILQTHKVAGHERQFSDQTLQAAHSQFKNGIGLRELLAIAAEKNNGYRGSSRDIKALCKGVFGGRARMGDDDARMDVGPSTIDVAGILSNVAHKTLGAAWLFSEQSWRRVARITQATDFKQMSEYRLNGAAKFEKISPGGEIKHGTLSDTTYTNQVANYGKLIGITYEDMVNDDLGAFITVTQELSRGGSDSFNEVFWTEFLDDSAFFNTDKSKNNYDDGATDSVLSLAGLDNADSIFAAQTKPDGTPLGCIPRILLVPRTLRTTAATLMKSTGVEGQGANAAPVPDQNPWAGMFEVVASLYLSSSSITGYSATAWYLGADPMDIAAMWVAFLNGQETPIVEAGEFDFNRLGLAMRAYMAFGCKKKEYRAMVKLKGAA